MLTRAPQTSQTSRTYRFIICTNAISNDMKIFDRNNDFNLQTILFHVIVDFQAMVADMTFGADLSPLWLFKRRWTNDTVHWTCGLHSINVDSGQFHMDMSSLIIGFVDAADTYSPCRQWLTGEIWGSSETPKSGLGFCLYLLDSLSKTNLLNLFAGRDMDTSYPVTVLRCQQRFASVGLGGTLL